MILYICRKIRGGYPRSLSVLVAFIDGATGFARADANMDAGRGDCRDFGVDRRAASKARSCCALMMDVQILLRLP